MNKIRFSSIIKTKDNSYWYSLGSWNLSSVPEGVPCILAYVPIESDTLVQNNQKKITLNGIEYVKVYGRSIDIYRTAYISSRKNIIRSQNFGKVVFVKPEQIIEVRDPKWGASKYISESSPYHNHLIELAEILKLDRENLGVSGSCLLFDVPRKRHELDFVIYGIEASRTAFRIIQEQRQSGLFSSNSIPPFHLPFEYKGLWFDPQFSEGDHEKPFLEDCKFALTHKEKNVSFTITNVQDSMFSPARYGTSNNIDFISCRPGHRGLWSIGQKVEFRELSLGVIEDTDGTQIEVYAATEDEWGIS